jgi:hypothetical protein
MPKGEADWPSWLDPGQLEIAQRFWYNATNPHL